MLSESKSGALKRLVIQRVCAGNSPNAIRTKKLLCQGSAPQSSHRQARYRILALGGSGTFHPGIGRPKV